MVNSAIVFGFRGIESQIYSFLLILVLVILYKKKYRGPRLISSAFNYSIWLSILKQSYSYNTDPRHLSFDDEGNYCYIARSSPHPPPLRRRGNHLSSFAEAAAGPEDVFLVLVTAPVLIGSGPSASAVLRQGGCGIDLVGKEKKGGRETFCAPPLRAAGPCRKSGRNLRPTSSSLQGSNLRIPPWTGVL